MTGCRGGGAARGKGGKKEMKENGFKHTKKASCRVAQSGWTVTSHFGVESVVNCIMKVENV